MPEATDKQLKVIELLYRGYNLTEAGRILLELKLSFLSMLIYALLLNRATLSAKNGWMNAEGSIYVYYPIASLAEAVGRKESVGKDALRTLRKKQFN